MLVAQYARTLAGIEASRARRGRGRGELADKDVDELIEMALGDPSIAAYARKALGQ